MPVVSVIVPIYNGIAYIHRCVDSILSQTDRDFELILIDDGSTDLSASVCDAYARSDERVKVVHKPNGGVSNARNIGLSVATGTYVAFCDGDDFIRNDLLERSLSEISKEQADILSFQLKRLSLNDIKKGGEINVDRVTDLNPENQFGFLEKVATWQTGGWQACRSVFKRSIIAEHQVTFCETCRNFAEDLGFTLEFLLYANRIVFLDEQLYFYDDLRETSMMNRSRNVCRVQDMNELSYFLHDKVQTAMPNAPFCLLHHDLVFHEIGGLYSVQKIKEINEWSKILKAIERKDFFKEQNRAYYLSKKKQKSIRYDRSRSVMIDRYLGTFRKTRLIFDLLIYRFVRFCSKFKKLLRTHSFS